jgi:peptidoglycan/LPS O-acetylase OafA/YrhL
MSYYPRINGLRCVAIFLVMFQHYAKYIAKYFDTGFYGVDLFFVISGFLVTGILLKAPASTFTENYRRFIGRRTLRIFPIYYLTIFLLWLLGLAAVRDNLIYLLTYTYNYAFIFKHLPRLPVNPYWSLCVEEQFYLFWPLVILSLRKKIRVLCVFTLFIILLGYAQALYNIFPGLKPYNYVSLLTRMAPLGLGSLGAIAAFKNWLPQRLFTNRLIEYGMLLLLLVTLAVNYHFKWPVLGICSLYLVLKAAFYGYSFTWFNQLLKNKKVLYLGSISYGIYIFHMPVRYYFTHYLLNPVLANIDFSFLGSFQKYAWHTWVIIFPVCTLLSIGLASLSFKYIEMPLLKWKDKLFPYQAGELVTAPV